MENKSLKSVQKVLKNHIFSIDIMIITIVQQKDKHKDIKGHENLKTARERVSKCRVFHPPQRMRFETMTNSLGQK